MVEISAKEPRLEVALADLERTVASCPTSQAMVRVGEDSRTIAGLVNHIADWLHLVAILAPDVGSGGVMEPSDEVIEELDARLAKAASVRDWDATVVHVGESIAELRRCLDGLGELTSEAAVEQLVARYATEHVTRHMAEIKSANDHDGSRYS